MRCQDSLSGDFKLQLLSEWMEQDPTARVKKTVGQNQLAKFWIFGTGQPGHHV